jgi:hypothetical protein
VYRLDNGNLYRDYYITDEDMPYDTDIGDYIYSLEKTTLIAQYINDDISLVINETIVLTVTATVDGWKPGSAERVYKIENRLN